MPAVCFLSVRERFSLRLEKNPTRAGLHDVCHHPQLTQEAGAHWPMSRKLGMNWKTAITQILEKRINTPCQLPCRPPICRLSELFHPQRLCSQHWSHWLMLRWLWLRLWGRRSLELGVFLNWQTRNSCQHQCRCSPHLGSRGSQSSQRLS